MSIKVGWRTVRRRWRWAWGRWRRRRRAARRIAANRASRYGRRTTRTPAPCTRAPWAASPASRRARRTSPGWRRRSWWRFACVGCGRRWVWPSRCRAATERRRRRRAQRRRIVPRLTACSRRRRTAGSAPTHIPSTTNSSTTFPRCPDVDLSACNRCDESKRWIKILHGLRIDQAEDETASSSRRDVGPK